MNQANISSPLTAEGEPPQTKVLSSSNKIQRTTRSNSLVFNLAAVALLMLMGGLGAAYWLDANGKPAPEVKPSVFDAPFQTKIVAGVTMQVPLEWMDSAPLWNIENADSLNFALNVKFSPNLEISRVKLHFSPITTTQPSAQLLDSVYALRFTQQQKTMAGLIGKPLRNEEGFQNETVWYDPISPTPFVVKCLDIGEQNTAANCLRTVQFSPRLALTYQFSSTQLGHWRDFDVTMAALLDNLPS